MSIKHVVLVEWKDNADEATINDFFNSVSDFVGKIDGVQEVEWGINFTDRAGNFSHAGIVTMDNKETLEKYGPHPLHQAALSIASPILKNIMVVDFVPN